MHHGELPSKPDRVQRLIADGQELPEDPVGMAVAGILVELLDGLVVELSYAQPPAIPHQWLYGQDMQAAIASRAGPGAWETQIVVNVGGGAAGLCAEGSAPPRLPGNLVDLPLAAFRAADGLAIQAGFDGNVITAPMERALQESIVIELIAGELERLSGSALSAVEARGLITDVLAELDRVAGGKVEGQPLSHGVVVLPSSSDGHLAWRYPQDYRQKRVPLLFDGRSAVLVINALGHPVTEVQRTRPERALPNPDALVVFTDQLGEAGGSLVAAASDAYNALGFFVHSDHSIWSYSDGSPLLVKRGGRWRAMPMAALATGLAQVAQSEISGGMAAAAAVLLSLHGHGGIIAIADSADELDGYVEAKDRVNRESVDSGPEAAVHGILDAEDLDTATLVRLASIDGATVLDRSGQLLAYGAVVTSSDSTAEGARTAAARSLSKVARVAVKVSEDGTITVFAAGTEIGKLLD